MKRQPHLICDMPGRFDQRERFLDAPFREPVVDDVAASLPLAPKTERFQEGVVKWSRRSDVHDPYIDMIENHSEKRWTALVLEPVSQNRTLLG